jgi:hypothetical protein
MTTLRLSVILAVLFGLTAGAGGTMTPHQLSEPSRQFESPQSGRVEPAGAARPAGMVLAEKRKPELSGSVSGDRSYFGRSAVTFGVNVKVWDRPAAGNVRFREGETQIGSARLKDGIAVYTLPKDLPVGKHRLDLVFEPSKATAADVEAGSWTYTVTVKKASASKAKTLASAHCKAIQRLSAAKVGTIKAGQGADRAEYRAYTKARSTDPSAKGKRYWQFLRDLGPGVLLGKSATTSAVYLRFTDFKPSTAQKYQTKALKRCVG